jgi:hypothetical protein
VQKVSQGTRQLRRGRGMRPTAGKNACLACSRTQAVRAAGTPQWAASWLSNPMVTTSRRLPSLNRSTISQLRDDIDAGRTGDKVDWPDPAAVPLGTDEEAAGTPSDSWAVDAARRIEVSRPCNSIAHRGVGAAWLLIAFAAALGAGLVAWILWQGG